jgi:GNAT superfamily N-acetyltransferase
VTRTAHGGALPPTSNELLRRAHGVAAAFNARMRSAVQGLPGNPRRIAVHRFGSAWATRCDLPDAEGWMNLLAPIDPADPGAMEAALAWYGEVRPRLEVTPVPGYEKLAPQLAARGLVQTHLLDILRGPVDAPPRLDGNPDVEVAGIARGDEPVFARTLLAGHVDAFAGDEARGLAALAAQSFTAAPDVPTLRCYLARVDGEPAAAAMLAVDGDVAYLANASALPAFRNRGCHSALIAARLRDAAELGCREVLGLAALASTSHRNMERAGLHTLVTVGTWTFPPHD